MEKDDDAKATVPSNELKETIDKISEAVLAGLRQQHENEQEPYEKYCKHVHLHLIKDECTFQKRCYQGYIALLEVLGSD